MNSFLQNHHRKLFYAIWALLNILQAAATQLIDDEAYYWVYSRFPAWGYFDHPPLTAILIRWGYAVFQNELGVRLLSVLLNVGAILLLENLAGRKNPFLFYAIVLGIASLQIFGFLAVPDNALLFFTALFFYAYRHFLLHSSFTSALMLGLAAALLFYTKYHGLPIVAFTLFSNIKLLGQPKVWIAGLFAFLLYSPHLYWQWQNDWVSFAYHLFESNVYQYKISFTTDYLLSQLLLAGPLAGLLLLPAAFLYRPQNKTESAMKLTMIGIYVLFFISSFRGKVEANWPAPALIPLVILSYRYICNREKFINPLRVITTITLALMMAGRIYLIVEMGPDNTIKRRFHEAGKWIKNLDEKTGDYPVVFNSSYQKASQYWFYSGKSSHNMHHYLSRKSNYNLWPTDLNLLGRAVFLATEDSLLKHTDSVFTERKWLYLSFDSSYVSLGKVSVNPEKKHYTIKRGETLTLMLRPFFPHPYDSIVASNPGLQTQLVVGISKQSKKIKEIETGITAHQLLNKKEIILNAGTSDLPPGKYTFILGFRVKNYNITHNSKRAKLVVEE